MNKVLKQIYYLPKKKDYSNYLSKIDKNLYYSNFGQLYNECVELVKKKLKIKKKKISVILTSSGHSSLLAILLLLKQKYKFKKKKYILVPSFNFHSSVHAITTSGFEPLFYDLNFENFLINEKELNAILKKNKSIAGIVFTSPMGMPLDIDTMSKIKKKYKISIIYDAADTFLNLDISESLEKEIFIAISFHPTKNIAANESGLIISNKENYSMLKSIINFGINPKTKECEFIGFNGKFSEFDAAILMASLKKFDIYKKKINLIKSFFLKEIKICKNIQIVGKKINNFDSLKLILLNKKKIDFTKIKKIFLKNKIEIFRPWSDKPLHKHKAFRYIKKLKLNNTEKLYQHFFCLPLTIKTTKKDIIRMVNKTNKILENNI